MGNRFIIGRHIRGYGYSSLRVFRRLNEADFEPHRLCPYGIGAGKFSYFQMFQKSRSRSAARLRERRIPKKTARQQARRQLWEA